jgi:citrate synthase
MATKHLRVQNRKEKFAQRTTTRIWQEVPAVHNPYLARQCRCGGYDLMDLIRKRSFVDVLFLLFLGRLPTRNQARLLETLMIAFINPGPRHPATRAAMNAGVGRTHPAHILPISLSVIGGNHLGGSEVTAAMRFLEKHLDSAPETTAEKRLLHADPPDEGDWRIAPGFGTRFGSIEPLSQDIAGELLMLSPTGGAMKWSHAFVEKIKPHGLGWLGTGICAAVFLDLGLPPRSGAGLFQLVCAPGLLAHGLELADKAITAMPFPDEEHYVIEKND